MTLSGRFRAASRWLPIALLPGCVLAQSFQSLAHACVPSADPITISAIVRTESAFRPYALSINRPETLASRLHLPAGRVFLRRQPKNRSEAIRWAHELLRSGQTISVGLMQVNVENSRYSVETLLNPCANLQIGWGMFVENYRSAVRRVGPGQRAVRMAISAYNTGSEAKGFRNGYVRTVLGNAR